MSVPTLPPVVNRRVSRSNSTTSSVSTIKHIGSKIGHRKSLSHGKPVPQARPTSSESINQHFTTLDAVDVHPQQGPNIAQDRGRSPNLNINRWSHSTTSSVGAIDNDILRVVAANTAAARSAKLDMPMEAAVIPKSQYTVNDPVEPSVPGPSTRRSPGRRPRSSRRSSPEALRERYNSEEPAGRAPKPTAPKVEDTLLRSQAADYVAGSATLLDHSRGANKYGHQVEGIALSFTSGSSSTASGPVRPRRQEQNKTGNGLHPAANSSHISSQQKPSHVRGLRKDRSENGSKDTAAGSSTSSTQSETYRNRGHRSAEQKNMLSQALSKANQAVLMDNAQNVLGAINAYVEACNILEHVMLKSSDKLDREKLAAIRHTYSTRIAELYDLDNSFEHLYVDKELPEAPATTRYLDGQDRISLDDGDAMQPSILIEESQQDVQVPPPQMLGSAGYINQQPSSPSSLSRQKVPTLARLTVPMDAKYMPSPLSPRRIPSPHDEEQATPIATLQPHAPGENPGRRISTGSTSWLDTFDENNSSVNSSRESSVDFGQRDTELVSAIEAELDAAVDAAYDDDEEMSAEATPRPSEASEVVSQPDPSLQMQASSEGMRSLASQPSQDSVLSDRRYDYLTRYMDEEAEDEEEILDMMMMTEGFALDNQDQRPGAMSSLPRQSDSSGVSARSSGRTWESSITTASQGTTLSTLAERKELPHHEALEAPKESDEATLSVQDMDVLGRKQLSPLPMIPGAERLATVPLRSRRLSGQGATQLKIETFTRRGSVSHQGQPSKNPLLEVPFAKENDSRPELTRSASGTNISIGTLPITPLASVHSIDSSTESPYTPGLMKILSNSTIDEDGTDSMQIDAEKVPAPVRKNTSATNLRPRNLSVTTSDLNNDRPSTPGSALFPSYSRQGISASNPAVSQPSPSVPTNIAAGGMYVFDHIADPVSPTSPRFPGAARPEPYTLEPCPESFLLRPFWLMRCLYQTLAHPKGGYLSNKLFIPRDIWRVKGVKIKAMDDKVGQCDMLTAALLKLAKVDTLDADAVLEELQSFDSIIDTVRTALAKKLGNDVGLTGSLAAMKNSPVPDEQDMPTGKSTSSVKSLTSSWRKLRSKSSNTVLTQPVSVRRDNAGDLTMSTLPMTSSSGVATSRSYKSYRHPPPTPTGMPHIPAQHASYMSSLARLFDAVQVLDSIARQVEDPGLKATSKTLVGLELSIRGAAEFFSFYVIRFALADIGLMMDKYLKRNSEWAMV